MCSIRARTRASAITEALSAVRQGLQFLASADATALTGAERADCLRELAAAESVHLAATSRILRAFDTAEDYVADGQGGPRVWLAWQTRSTRPAAGAAMAWTRRLAARPQVAAALAAGQLSVSYARRICDWLDELPADAQAAAEEILVAAAVAGADLAGLFTLVEEIRLRTARPDSDGDDEAFGRRTLFLDSYFRGHGSLRGDLTPAASAAVQAVLDALGGRTGPEDDRTKAQRYHDALEEACRRLIASGCLPDRAGQPAQIVLHMTLAQLLGRAGLDPALAAWLGATGVPAPPGADCDAQIVPIVTGTIDPDVLADLASRFPGTTGPDSRDTSTSTSNGNSDGNGSATEPTRPDIRDSSNSNINSSATEPTEPDTRDNLDSDSSATEPTEPDTRDSGNSNINSSATEPTEPDTRDNSNSNINSSATEPTEPVADHTVARARRAAAGLTVADAVRLLSGPGGLAAQLRSQLTGPAATVSLPLDVGAATDTIPVQLRRAVSRRDHHCRFPGCDQPAVVCHVHHLRPRADGGVTSITNCCLLCSFHHLIAVHRWGWTLVLNPDGTTTAVSPDGTRTFHSHAPRQRHSVQQPVSDGCRAGSSA
jgi:Domain of unknown function (DUF222)